MARGLAREWGLPIAVSRFANVYGGGDLNYTRLVPETAIAVADGRAPRIRSDGAPRRTSSTSTTRSRPTSRSRRRSTAKEPRARPSTRVATVPTRCARWST